MKQLDESVTPATQHNRQSKCERRSNKIGKFIRVVVKLDWQSPHHWHFFGFKLRVSLLLEWFLIALQSVVGFRLNVSHFFFEIV